MPYHDLSLMQAILAKQFKELKTQIKTLFLRRRLPLALPPTSPDHNAPPPDHWMGYWICSNCNTWLYPTYRRGPHPYDYLRCINPRCKAVITPEVRTSPALHRVVIPAALRDFVRVERLTGTHREQVPYFAACPCGLTHRARLYEPGLYRRWRQFAEARQREPVLGKLRRFVRRRDEGEVTAIEFGHLQCNKCYRRYDVYGWQHFVIYQDVVFHIDGGDEHGRWAEISHKE